jgi:hypothetical protein
MTHQFEVTVKKTGKVLRTLTAYGDDRAEARKTLVRLFRNQYDPSFVELAR